MKISFLITFLTLAMLASCMTSKVSLDNNYDYSILKPDSKYLIKTKDGNKIRQFTFNKETDTQIIGMQENKEIQVDKNNIDKVSKFSAGKTIPLIIAGVAVAILVPAYAKNKPVGQ